MQRPTVAYITAASHSGTSASALVGFLRYRELDSGDDARLNFTQYLYMPFANSGGNVHGRVSEAKLQRACGEDVEFRAALGAAYMRDCFTAQAFDSDYVDEWHLPNATPTFRTSQKLLEKDVSTFIQRSPKCVLLVHVDEHRSMCPDPGFRRGAMRILAELPGVQVLATFSRLRFAELLVRFQRQDIQAGYIFQKNSKRLDSAKVAEMQNATVYYAEENHACGGIFFKDDAGALYLVDVGGTGNMSKALKKVQKMSDVLVKEGLREDLQVSELKGVSVHTLFMSISGGLTWMDATMALAQISWIWVYVFSCYIAFSVFAVLNVMTGVFCQSAIKGAERDQEMVVQSLIMDKHQLKTSLGKLFQKMDDDQSGPRNLFGKLTLAQFEKHFQDEEVRVLFEALEIGATDAWSLFLSLDHNEDYQIEPEEFLEGCLQLRGSAKAIDLFMLQRQVAKIMMHLSTRDHSFRSAHTEVGESL
eukprot:s625_g27.t1